MTAAPSESSPPHAARSRIAALDGFRAVAVVLVVAFHYLSDLALRSTPTLYPFGGAYAQIPLLKHGNLGVDLFFMVSGFVIAMTLESSRGPVDFAIKRLARLLPSMLLCSLITAAVLLALPHPTWHVAAIDFLPGWTFISEHVWSRWLGREVGLVDTVYWTLFVEAVFYLLAALLYFGLRRVSLLLSLGLAMNLMWVLVRLPPSVAPAWLVDTLKFWLLWNHLPLFVAGVAFHCLHHRRHVRVAAFIALETLVMLWARDKQEPVLMGLHAVFFALFAGLVHLPRGVAVFALPPVAAVGASSYVFYLLHNRIGVSLTYNLGLHAPPWLQQSPLIPLAVGVAIGALSHLLYRRWELPARSAMLRWSAGLRAGGKAASALVVKT